MGRSRLAAAGQSSAALPPTRAAVRAATPPVAGAIVTRGRGRRMLAALAGLLVAAVAASGASADERTDHEIQRVRMRIDAVSRDLGILREEQADHEQVIALATRFSESIMAPGDTVTSWNKMKTLKDEWESIHKIPAGMRSFSERSRISEISAERTRLYQQYTGEMTRLIAGNELMRLLAITSYDQLVAKYNGKSQPMDRRLKALKEQIIPAREQELNNLEAELARLGAGR